MADGRVSPLIDGQAGAAVEVGEALCLSGGGYRAMLFHLGTFWRLHEAGVLPGLRRISSVSGGSITSAALAVAWRDIDFSLAPSESGFVRRVVSPVRALASRTLDDDAVIGGVLLPGTVGDRIAAAYARHLFGDATLQDLPDQPRFVINATNVQSGALWRFSKPYMGDWRVGRVLHPRLDLATAVAASSAFPPVLSPLDLRLEHDDFQPGSGNDLQRRPFTEDVVLTDGGVYDNMGLETVWKRYATVYVSDAGGKMQPEPEPRRDWARHAYRVLDIVDNQVRSLRKRAVMEAFEAPVDSAGARRGAYWGIATPHASYSGRSPLDCPPEATAALAAVPTRLKRLEDGLQERLVNWGYAACDASLQSNFAPELPRPSGFPYPASGI